MIASPFNNLSNLTPGIIRPPARLIYTRGSVSRVGCIGLFGGVEETKRPGSCAQDVRVYSASSALSASVMEPREMQTGGSRSCQASTRYV